MLWHQEATRRRVCFVVVLMFLNIYIKCNENLLTKVLFSFFLYAIFKIASAVKHIKYRKLTLKDFELEFEES